MSCVDKCNRGGIGMEDGMQDSFTRVEEKIARVEEQLYRSCRSGEESIRELRDEVGACLNGWMKSLVLGAAFVTCLAVARGR
jgi:hypothetical protein